MKVSILTIATGKYISFIPRLIESCEENFLRGVDKEYYIFTDCEDHDLLSRDNLFFVKQEKLGWPYDTMMRFHMFLGIEKLIKKSDYCFFMNANLEILEAVEEEILPKLENFVAVKHPGFFTLDKSYMPFESNANSNFFVPMKKREMYYQGCFNGGKTKDWLKLCRLLSKKIDSDLNKGIVPIWHDESAINWYFNSLKKPLELEPVYSLPEQIYRKEFAKSVEFNMHSYDSLENEKPIIMQRDKKNYGGSEFLRA